MSPKTKKKRASAAAKKKDKLSREAKEATKLLRGKTVRIVRRHRAREVLVEFKDGTRLFVDGRTNRLELSITEK